MIISIFKDIQITQFTRKGITWHTPLNDIVGLSLYLLGTFENKNIKNTRYVNISPLLLIIFVIKSPYEGMSNFKYAKVFPIDVSYIHP